MAENDDLIDPKDLEAGKEAKKRKAPLMLVVIALLGLVLYMNYDGIDVKNEKKTTAGYDKKKADEEARKRKQKKEPLKVSGPSQDSVVRALESEVIKLRKKLDRMKQISEKNRRLYNSQMAKMQREFTAKLNQIVDEIRKNSFANVQNQYRSGKSGRLPNIPNVPTQKTDSDEKKPKLFDYRVIPAGFAPQSATASQSKKKDGKKSQGGSPLDKFLKPSNSQTKKQGERTQVKTVEKKRETVSTDIPAGSFAHVTNLHGADCPVTGGKLDSLFAKKVVVLPLLSSFKGPNNAEIDLGRAHLIGICVGQKNGERALIKVEKLSYYADGKQQFIPVNGYIIDARDGNEGIKGTLISTKLKDVSKSALAAGLATIGTIANASQFTNSTSVSTGTTTSTLSGDVKKAFVGSAVGASFEKLAQLYAANAESSVDIVHIKGGVKLRFVTTTPFKVEMPKPEVIDDEDE